MAAAIEIADQEGWDHVTIRKIADRVLYTPPIVYEHFDSKDDLFNHLVKQGFEQLYIETRKLTETVNSPEDKLLKMAEARYEFAASNATLHSMMFDVNNPEWGKREVLKAMKRIKDMVYGWIEEISNDPQNNDAHFIHLISLILGYTFIAKHMSSGEHISRHFSSDPGKNMKSNFLSAIRRFIQSIKQKQ
jgi:AcrR family transcriptional regulator